MRVDTKQPWELLVCQLPGRRALPISCCIGPNNILIAGGVGYSDVLCFDTAEERVRRLTFANYNFDNGENN